MLTRKENIIMATAETLEEKVKKARLEQEARYPLLDIRDSRKEIREICELASDYLLELNPEVKKPQFWELMARIPMEFLKEVFTYLNDRKTTEVGEIYLPLGNILEVGIQFTKTDGDKEGTLNPVIRCKDEFNYKKKDEPYDDSLSVEMNQILESENHIEHLLPQFFDDREVIGKISESVKGTLSSKYGVTLIDWTLIPTVFVAFFRKAKDYLILHKDDGECGVEIKFGDLCNIGIERFGSDEEIDYELYVTPGQIFKKDFAKGDEMTEN